MATCAKCKCWGLFLKLSPAGLCRDCEAERIKREAEEAEVRRAEQARTACENAKATRRQMATDMLAAIPHTEVGQDGQKGEEISPNDGHELKYSGITSRNKLSDLGSYVAIDLETAGLRANNAVLEVSAIRFEDFAPVAIYTTLIRPSKPIPEEITKINGITNDMVENSPRIWQIMPSLRDFIGDYAIVGHNLPFDLKFLIHWGFYPSKKQKLYDTLAICQKKLKKANYDYSNDYDVDDHKLTTVCNYYLLDFDGAHRSAADALAAGRLFAKLAKDWASKD